MKKLRDCISNKIKEKRREIGLTQQQLADKCGMSQSYLNEIESGKKPFRAIDRLQSLAEALDYPCLTVLVATAEIEHIQSLPRPVDLEPLEVEPLSVGRWEARKKKLLPGMMWLVGAKESEEL